MTQKFTIGTLRHPRYLADSLDWEKWRDTFEGGEYYRDRYLVKFQDRETDTDFSQRRELTPIPAFAKSALLDVRNNIYQRLVSVSRIGGSKTYRDAIAGINGGVDGEGSTIDSFIGDDVLTELLLMGKVGVYVDAAPPEGPTLADKSYPPFLTYYRVEDILSYTKSARGVGGGEFQSVLLRDHNVTVTTEVGGVEMPSGSEERLRLVWKDELGQVWYRLYNSAGEVLRRDGSVPDGAVLTNLKRVPFVLMDIGDSLMKDVASYQRALLNLSSSDVYYAIKSNAPFLTIQRDPFASGDHLKQAESAEGASGAAENLGAGKGRYYDTNLDRPGFISPSTDPLEASMKLQDRLEANIRSLINLAVQGKAGSRTESAESKKVGQGGLEAGLSFIGMALAKGEKLIADIWAEYEDVVNPKPAIIHYPDRYVLKSDMERQEEAKGTLDLVDRLPTQELKRVASKMIVDSLLSGKVPQLELDKIYRKIDSNDYIMSDPQNTLEAHKAGLVDDKTASEALGYDSEKVVEQARKDRAKRIAETLKAQTPKDAPAPGEDRPAARGAPELDGDPNSGAVEKDESLEDKPKADTND